MTAKTEKAAPAARRGHCNCGSISFELKTDLDGIIICHCSICRRATGGNGIAVAVVDTTAFEWRSGKDLITSWKKPDADWQIWFCRNCGSPVPGINDESRMFIPAGLLDDIDDSLSVTDHIWVDSKASWDKIADNGRCHVKAFEP